MSLPFPTEEMLAHSQHLSNIIRDKIKASGPISFAEFMNLALYYPGLGYYSAGAHKLGKEGDFITAPELSPLFSFTIANYIASVLPSLSEKNLFEFGAGSGKMAAAILLRLDELNSLPDHYYILDLSADLRERQAATIEALCPQFIDRVIWLDNLPDKFTGMILANEVLDAMPVHVFNWHDNVLYERYVDWQHDQFWWVDKIPETMALRAYLQPYIFTLSQPYISEINLAANDWIKTLGACLQSGEVLLIDYGFTDPEFYHPQRNMGTLMCHYQHHAHSDPFLWPGLQDITTHVNFSQIANAAVAAGFTVEEYDSQANFLMKYGILDMAQHDDLVDQYEAAQALKQLLLPTEMGELFKVMRLRKPNLKQSLHKAQSTVRQYAKNQSLVAELHRMRKEDDKLD
jgi:SAM-dependent MidA family methyltransferase